MDSLRLITEFSTPEKSLQYMLITVLNELVIVMDKNEVNHQNKENKGRSQICMKPRLKGMVKKAGVPFFFFSTLCSFICYEFSLCRAEAVYEHSQLPLKTILPVFIY